MALANAGDEIAGIGLAVVHLLDPAAVELAVEEKPFNRVPVRTGKRALARALAVGEGAFVGAAISGGVFALAFEVEVEVHLAEVFTPALFGAGALQGLGDGGRTGGDDADVASRGDVLPISLASEGDGVH